MLAKVQPFSVFSTGQVVVATAFTVKFSFMNENLFINFGNKVCSNLFTSERKLSYGVYSLTVLKLK